MRIELDDNYILESDRYCYWISRVVHRGKTHHLRRISGYYSDLNQVIDSFIDNEIKSLETENFRQLAKEVENLKRTVRKWKPKLQG